MCVSLKLLNIFRVPSESCCLVVVSVVEQLRVICGCLPEVGITEVR